VAGRRLIEDVLALARIPAPTFAEEPRIAWLQERLAAARGERRRDAVGSLIWSIGERSLRLLLAAHVDTVFPEGTLLEARRDADRLTGPGIGDNAAAVAVVIQVVEELPASPGLAVAFTVGEEGLGNLRGAIAACEALRPEAFVAVEGHGLEHVVVDGVGSVRARVTVTGPGGHSWVNRGRPSAVHALLDLGAAVTRLGTAEAPVNVGVVSGGRSVNTIADQAEFVVERRALDEAPLDAFAAELKRLETPEPLAVSIELLGRRPSGRLDPGAPLLAAVRAARAELGLPDRLEAGSTDANAALARGIPALTLGVAHGGGMHTLDEWIDAGSLDLGARQLELVLRRFLPA